MGFDDRQMTSLERIESYWSGKEVDRLPYSMDLGESIVPYFGYSNKEYLFSPDIMVEVEGRVIAEFGGDGMGFSINTRAFAEAFGSDMVYPDYGYSDVKQHLLRNYGKTQDLEPVNVYKDGRLPIILEATKRLQDKYGKTQPIGISVPCPGNCALGLCKMETLLEGMILDPDWFYRIMDYCLASVLECIRVFYRETGISISIFEVLASTQIMGRTHFLKYLKPYIKRTVDGIKKITGQIPSFGGCGHNAPIWNELLELGITSVTLDAQDSISLAKAEIGNRASIGGNVNPMVLLTGSKEDITLAVHSCIKEGSDNPRGFSLGLGGGSAPFGASLSNLKTYAACAKKYGYGAKMGQLCKGIQANL